MSKSSLELLFDSKVKVKVLKFLFRNMGSSFTEEELVAHVQEPGAVVRKELKKLLDVGLLKLKK
jgi:predicted transcriptional regulator